ncbi:MAG: hypothetical protein ABSH00_05785 [Bryobacteraceae bacterium]
MKRELDAKLKVGRAREHLDSLKRGLAAFRESNPCSVFREEDVEHQRYRLRIEVKEYPVRIALIVGDLFYCLRCALDQMVFALAKGDKAVYPVGTQFPIIERLNSKGRREFERYTAGIPAEALDVIDALQPYRRADGAPATTNLLWCLNLMCNIDKHRRIPVHSEVAIINFPKFPQAQRHLLTFEDDNTVVSGPLSMKDEMAFDPTGSFQVVFGDSKEGIEMGLDRIEQIHDLVANKVIPSLSRFFEQVA